jgi:hypothetical protein
MHSGKLNRYFPAEETFGSALASGKLAGVHISIMPESRTIAVSVPTRAELLRTWSLGAVQAAGHSLSRTGAWAADTAQQFGALVSVLMGPAIISAYAFAAWSLAANLGWTDSFLFSSGALSNSFVWVGAAALLHLASGILRRHTRSED